MKKTLIGAALLLASSSAFAGIISFGDTTPLSTTSWTDTLSVSQFDSSLGQLDTINISFSATMFSDLLLNNNDASAQDVNGNVFIQTSGSFLGLDSLNLMILRTTGLQNLASDDGAVGGFDEYRLNGITASDMVTATIDASHADFLSFIGAGNLSTTGFGTVGGFGASGGGANIVVEVETTASAALNVTYNYSEEPSDEVEVSEPATLAFLGLGLAGIALRRKKKSL